MSVYKSLPEIQEIFISHPATTTSARRTHNSRRYVFFALFAFFFAGTLSYLITKNPTNSSATIAGFNPGNIINDYTMSNYNSMTEAEIQAFLTAKNPCNNTNYDTYQYFVKHYTEELGRPASTHSWHFADGHFICLSEELFGEGTAIGVADGETAAHIIWQAAQDYKINPQVLIVLLEKEQGLITDSIPRSGQYRSATGYGCPDNSACDAKYYGFKNQVRNAAALFRLVLDGDSSYYPIGNNYVPYNPDKTCGGSWVNIENRATSALYRYTPYQPNSAALATSTGKGNDCSAYGNRNFYHYFTAWFGSTQTLTQVSPPTNIKVSQVASDLVITWDASADISYFKEGKYSIVVADQTGHEITAEVDTNTTSYTYRNIQPGRYIAASVQAVTESSKAHNRITFDILFGTAKPNAPTDLEVEYKNGGIQISWSKPSNLTETEEVQYEIVLADSNKKEYSATLFGNQTSYTFYSLPMSSFFAASVKAVNNLGSNFSRTTFMLKNYNDNFHDTTLYTGFSDMPTDATSKTAISWAVNNGITDKNPTFQGENSLTRRQAMVLLWRIAGKPDTTLYTGFSDMPTDATSKTAISWAVNNGITDKNPTFQGENSLTRRQAMVIFYRFYLFLTQ